VRSSRAREKAVPSVTVATEILQALLEHLLVAAEREVELPAELFELCVLQVFDADVLGPERPSTVRVAGERETVFRRAWSHRRLLVQLPL
jgi:hypothetical protein